MVYVSHANAVAYLLNSRETVGLVDAMTVLQRETYLGRAWGARSRTKLATSCSHRATTHAKG